MPDPETFVVLPYAPRSGQMIANMVELDHQPWALDPRAFLQRMVAAAAAKGLTFDAAFENEFFLAYRKDDGFVPVDRSLCFSAIGMESTEPVIQDIIAALTDQGLTVELSHPELGWGQQELSIRHTPALRAADNQITYRQTVRAVAAQHGMVATLAPKPWADQAGSGAHLHWSIWDTDHTVNKLAEAAAPAGLSTLARQAVAGVLAHLPALAGDDDPERQFLPPPPTAFLEFRVYGVGHREPRGRCARPDPLLGRRGSLDEPRAEGERRERQPVHRARWLDGGGSRRYRTRPRSRRTRRTRIRATSATRSARSAGSGGSR